MNDLYRQAGGGGGGAGTAVTESKQADYSNNKSDGEYWNEVHNELSPVRKHLIHTYLQIQDEEALPFLGEYFGVALSFMAMGALVRASNSSKKRRKSMSDEERLDLRACSRFQRMALESMLREAMERLRGLAQNAYQMEERVRDLVEGEMEKDNEKGVLLSRISEAEKAVHELKSLRKAEGRANERVMSIVAAKEQDWLREKRNLQKEIERLKENLNTVCREVKFQSRRCRNPTCEHCKGIERVVRNVRGRVSLRELNSRDTSAHVSPRREVVKVEQLPEVEEVEEERVLVKALEQKKKRSERPGHLQVHDKVERNEKHVNWTTSRSSVNPSGGSAGGAGQFVTKELIAKQQQDMESELANILKRVGMLKQRSHSSSATTTGQQNTAPVKKNVSTSPERTERMAPLESSSFSLEDEDVNAFSDKPVAELTKVEPGREEQVPSSFISGLELELADDLTTGLLTLDQEALLAVQEDPDLLELEKAFEFESGLETPETTNNITDASGDGNQIDAKNLTEVGTARTTQEAQTSIDEDTEYAEFESYLSSEEGVTYVEKSSRDVDSSNATNTEEAKTTASSAAVSNTKEVSRNAIAEATEVMVSEVELPFSANLQTECRSTLNPGNVDPLLITIENTAVSELPGTTTCVVGESNNEYTVEANKPGVDVVQNSLELYEIEETHGEVENVGQRDPSVDAASEAESPSSGEQSSPLDELNETTTETSLQRDQGSPTVYGYVENSLDIPSQEVIDGEDLPEPVVLQDDQSEPVSELSVNSVDNSLAEEVKIVDAGDSSEPEQVLEMVKVDSGTGLPERQETPVEDFEDGESSAIETDLTRHEEEAVTTGEKSNLDAEIPVFERAGSEDLAGDLPEPDEKRVCEFSEAEVDIVEDAGTADKSLTCEEGENEKADDLVVPGDCEIPLESESVADLLKISFDPLDMVSVPESNSSRYEEGKSSKLAVEVDSAVEAE